jgi:hypothetical protein
VFTPGSPGYISAEVAVRDLRGADEARSWANDSWAHQSNRIISRSEALMRPVYRQAVEAWERGNDDVMQTTEVAQIRREVREEAAGIAELGCREAASALAGGDDERIYAVVSNHGHDERCGGRCVAEGPRPRAFTIIS